MKKLRLLYHNINNTFKIFFQKLPSHIIKTKDKHPCLKKEEYYKSFGIEKDCGIYKIVDGKEKLLENAYKKAWDNRDFEINKFWTRAAYFWGFIVLTLGGYITLLTGKDNKDAIKVNLDLYLVLMGFLFSITWYLVILGSKNWQKNWERHIDMLEDFVSGPIYKTIYYSGKQTYSVSKLNEVMSIFMMLVWFFLLIHHIYNKFTFTINLREVDTLPTLAILLTFLFAIILRFGYSSGSYTSDTNGFLNRWE